MSETIESVLKAIDSGQFIRGWIANGYAQVEYLLGDIIMKSRSMPEYEGVVHRLPHRVEKRIAKIREILEFEGFFQDFRDEILDIVERFETHHQTRNLLAHGFCTAYHTPDGDFGLEFRKWHRDGERDAELKRTFRLVDLEYERAQLLDVSKRALHLSNTIHKALGLVGP